jgi:DNA-binding LytR/AlgR family response regulator
MSKLFCVRSEGALLRIFPNEIKYLEANDNYTKFHFHNDQVLVRIALDTVLAELPEGMFGKVHRSFAVAFNHVAEVQKEAVIMDDFRNVPREQKVYVSVPVSRKYYPEFVEQFTILGG